MKNQPLNFYAKGIIITGLLIIFQIPLFAQCIEQNTSTNGAISNSLGIGQTFKACQSAQLEEISFRTGGSFTPSTVTLNLRNPSCGVIWTVTNIPTGPNQTIVVDLGNGSGSSRALTVDDTYTFNIVFPSGGSGATKQIRTSDSNPYADGFLTRLDCTNYVGMNQDMWFRVGIGQSLPVELIDFRGHKDEKSINLNWETASELNNSGFNIEKSNNGREWEQIGFINGDGTTTEIKEYQYQDTNPFSGINYYRLKQIDFDGRFEYSKVIAVEYDNSEKGIKVFPNPSNGLINLQIDNPLNQRMKIKISDNLGRKVWESDLIEEESNWRKEMEIANNGIYFVTAQIGNEVYYERVIITNEK